MIHCRQAQFNKKFVRGPRSNVNYVKAVALTNLLIALAHFNPWSLLLLKARKNRTDGSWPTLLLQSTATQVFLCLNLGFD